MNSPEQSVNQESQPTPHELAQKHLLEIKKSIQEKFSIDDPEKIELLLGDENGVYLQQEDATTLCCLAFDRENKFLYLVTSKIEPAGQGLYDFKCDIIG